MAAAAAAALVAKSILKPKVEPLPEVKKPTVMPIQDDVSAQAARRRKITEQMAGTPGRASTILTDTTNTKDKFGG